MSGLLSARGINVSEHRVGKVLCKIISAYQAARTTTTERHINPVPYHTDYPGHKLHLDQNEKLSVFSVTHIAAADGHSRIIVGFLTMPVKNSVKIYGDLYRMIVIQYGLWDQIRIDQGKEWVLILYVQECLAHMRCNTTRLPHLQSTSKQNHCVERIWVEINAPVNYPMKACLIALKEAGDIDMDCSHTKYCVSWYAIGVANIRTNMAVQAWNNHRIPGHQGGVPIHRMMENNQAIQIDSRLLPDTDSAVEEYETLGHF